MATSPADPSTHQLQCSQEQLQFIYRALEQFFRTRMGQFLDFVDDLIFDENFKMNRDDPDQEEKLNALIQRREDAKTAFEQAYRIACPGIRYKTRDEQCAIDIWEAIRYYLWCQQPEPKLHDSVASRKPLNLAGMPPIHMQKITPAERILIDATKGTFVCSNCNRQDHMDQLAMYCRYCGAKFTESK